MRTDFASRVFVTCDPFSSKLELKPFPVKVITSAQIGCKNQNAFLRLRHDTLDFANNIHSRPSLNRSRAPSINLCPRVRLAARASSHFSIPNLSPDYVTLNPVLRSARKAQVFLDVFAARSTSFTRNRFEQNSLPL